VVGFWGRPSWRRQIGCFPVAARPRQTGVTARAASRPAGVRTGAFVDALEAAEPAQRRRLDRAVHRQGRHRYPVNPVARGRRRAIQLRVIERCDRVEEPARRLRIHRRRRTTLAFATATEHIFGPAEPAASLTIAFAAGPGHVPTHRASTGAPRSGDRSPTKAVASPSRVSWPRLSGSGHASTTCAMTALWSMEQSVNVGNALMLLVLRESTADRGPRDCFYPEATALRRAA